MSKITVKDKQITVLKVNDEDYRNTLEYIGIWEQVYNPDFNYGEFAIIKSQSGLNSFKISVKEFVARTNAISIQARNASLT